MVRPCRTAGVMPIRRELQPSRLRVRAPWGLKGGMRSVADLEEALEGPVEKPPAFAQFFEQEQAFSNIARALVPGGRLALIAWLPLAANEWIREISGALAAGAGPAGTTGRRPGSLRAVRPRPGARHPDRSKASTTPTAFAPRAHYELRRPPTRPPTSTDNATGPGSGLGRGRRLSTAATRIVEAGVGEPRVAPAAYVQGRDSNGMVTRWRRRRTIRWRPTVTPPGAPRASMRSPPDRSPRRRQVPLHGERDARPRARPEWCDDASSTVGGGMGVGGARG